MLLQRLPESADGNRVPADTCLRTFLSAFLPKPDPHPEPPQNVSALSLSVPIHGLIQRIRLVMHHVVAVLAGVYIKCLQEYPSGQPVLESSYSMLY
ncbi:hypothetical protein ACLOJK_007505 [Asimina triloba]